MKSGFLHTRKGGGIGIWIQEIGIWNELSKEKGVEKLVVLKQSQAVSMMSDEQTGGDVVVVDVAIIIMVMKIDINGDSNNRNQTWMKAKMGRCWTDERTEEMMKAARTDNKADGDIQKPFVLKTPTNAMKGHCCCCCCCWTEKEAMGKAKCDDNELGLMRNGTQMKLWTDE